MSRFEITHDTVPNANYDYRISTTITDSPSKRRGQKVSTVESRILIIEETPIYQRDSRNRASATRKEQKMSGSRLMEYSPQRHQTAKMLASNPHPFGITKKEITRSPEGIKREIKSTGRKDQFDRTFGKIYDCPLLGEYDEVPKYRWDGGFRDQVQSYATPEKMIQSRLFDRSTATSSNIEAYYS